MDNCINWEDIFYTSKERTVFTYNELQIPGLKAFGRHTMVNAVAPLPNHYHENSFEFTFVYHAAVSFSVDNINYKFSGNDVFMTRPNEIHSTNSNPMAAGELIWFQLDISQVHNFLFLSDEAANDLIIKLKQLNCRLIKTGNNGLWGDIKRAFEMSKNCLSKYQTANYIVFILFELIKYANQTQFQLTPDIGRSIDYILNNITLELTMDEIAEVSILSTSQFKQKFKSQLGIAPRHFINMQKIELSKEMMEDGMSITDVAMALGFNTSSYFSVVFKRYNAYSPSEYLKHKAHKVPEYFKF